MFCKETTTDLCYRNEAEKEESQPYLPGETRLNLGKINQI